MRCMVRILTATGLRVMLGVNDYDELDIALVFIASYIESSMKHKRTEPLTRV